LPDRVSRLSQDLLRSLLEVAVSKTKTTEGVVSASAAKRASEEDSDRDGDRDMVRDGERLTTVLFGRESGITGVSP
jgi:hypothetical protein